MHIEIKKKECLHGNVCSRCRKENNMVIVVNAKSQQEAKQIVNALQDTIRKENRILENGLSYELYYNVKGF